ncbi:MAG: putative Ig domain-containing protein [Synergistaceae bacterium]|nr:putative Ig domain-containing protein [Synergistaceae bacterium]
MSKCGSKFLAVIVAVMALCCPAWADVVIDAESFPDDVFRAYIAASVDKNLDGVLSDAELAVKSLDIDGKMTSLQGLELFTSLQELYIYAKQLTALDLSGHTSLQGLEIDAEQLTSLNLSGLSSLLYLGVECKRLAVLNMSGCTSLEETEIRSDRLRELDLSWLTSLQTLRLDCIDYEDCIPTSLDLSGCTSLQELYEEGWRLTSLNVSGCTALRDLSIEGDDESVFSALNVSGCTALVFLDCQNNRLNKLDVSGCTALGELYVCGNRLTELDVSQNSALTGLDCSENKLSALDVNNTKLVYLSCYSNDLTQLDVSKNPVLDDLDCGENNLTALDVSHNTLLKHLRCYDNKLTEIDISNNPLLETLAVSGNFIPAFDLSSYPKLSFIGCNFTISDSGNAYDFNLTDFMAAYHLDGLLDDTFEFSAYCISGDYDGWTFAGSREYDYGYTYEKASMYISSGKIILHFPNPNAKTLTGVSFRYTNSSGERVWREVSPASELLSGTAPVITTSSLSDGFTGTPYGVQLAASGTSPFTWTADSLPDGLSLSSSGYLSGNPTFAGTFTLTFRVSNSAGSASKSLALKVSASPEEAKPSITTDAIDKAAAGSAYSFQLAASGTPPFTWSIKGNLPEGLSLSSSGRITGTPTKKGSKSFTATAKNDYGSAQKKLTLNVYELPEITTETLKEATVGKKYSESLKAKGSKPLKWKLEGYLPDGIKFDAEKGKFSGTPTNNNTGLIRVTLSNEDGEAVKIFTLKVNATPPTIATKKIKDGKYGKKYSAKFKAKGTEPITFALSGTLPAGLSFDAEEGTIEGTPIEACTDRKITITASNIGGSAAQEYSLTIKGVAPKITSKSLPDGTVGVSYSQDIAVTGTQEITWSASGLPDGLSINSTYGTILGTPTKAGKFKVTVTAKNSVKSVKKSFKLKISEAGQSRVKGNIYSFNEETYSEPVSENYEYVIVAVLPEVSADVPSMYDFTVKLSDDAEVGEELVYLAESSVPSDDDVIAEFSDESGEETGSVPESRTINLSVWLNPDRIYKPSIAVKR